MSAPKSPVPFSFTELLRSRRVLITVGAGGVGKTTTAAALALAAAREGKRVLCLTIDPAKRLAQSLGLEVMTTEAVDVAPERFSAAGVKVTGSLTVMMLDPKGTFDELVLKYSSTRERAQKLLQNRLYQYLSTSLAGTREYMAMEKLVAVKDDSRFDLIVLDTPPTANALDFLDAPKRLVEALDSPAVRWFVEAFQSSGKFSLNLIAKSAAVVLRAVGKITGSGFLEPMAELIRELNELFGGFKQRAQLVESALRSNEVSFVLVTSPAPMSVREALFFHDRLAESRMPRGAFVVNRFHLPPAYAGETILSADAAEAARKMGAALEDDAGTRLVQAHVDAVKLAQLDAMYVKELHARAANVVPIVTVPELASDVHDLALLADLADRLEGRLTHTP